MLKKTITYEDHDGNEITEDFWFHLSKAELLDLEMRTGEGFEAYGKKLIAAEDKRELVALFKEILLMSYGVRDPNNAKRFIKSDQLSKEFSETNAFVELYVSLFRAENMLEFFKGVIPKVPVDKQSVPIGRVELPVQQDNASLNPNFDRTVLDAVFGEKKDAEGNRVHRLSLYDQHELVLLGPEQFEEAKRLEMIYRSGK